MRDAKIELNEEQLKSVDGGSIIEIPEHVVDAGQYVGKTLTCPKCKMITASIYSNDNSNMICVVCGCIKC